MVYIIQANFYRQNKKTKTKIFFISIILFYKSLLFRIFCHLFSKVVKIIDNLSFTMYRERPILDRLILSLQIIQLTLKVNDSKGKL